MLLTIIQKNWKNYYLINLRDSQILGSRLLGRLNIVWWHLLFVGLQLLYVILLIHRIFRWLLFFRKIFTILIYLDILWFAVLKEWSCERNNEHFLNLILTSIMAVIYSSNYLLTCSYVMTSLEILVWQHAGTFGGSCSFRPTSLLTFKGNPSLLWYLYSL